MFNQQQKAPNVITSPAVTLQQLISSQLILSAFAHQLNFASIGPLLPSQAQPVNCR